LIFNEPSHGLRKVKGNQVWKGSSYCDFLWSGNLEAFPKEKRCLDFDELIGDMQILWGVDMTIDIKILNKYVKILSTLMNPFHSVSCYAHSGSLGSSSTLFEHQCFHGSIILNYWQPIYNESQYLHNSFAHLTHFLIKIFGEVFDVFLDI
jgi:hypothetical protein